MSNELTLSNGFYSHANVQLTDNSDEGMEGKVQYILNHPTYAEHSRKYFANNIKVHSIDVPSDISDNAYNMVGDESAMQAFWDAIETQAEDIGITVYGGGRMGGWLYLSDDEVNVGDIEEGETFADILAREQSYSFYTDEEPSEEDKALIREEVVEKINIIYSALVKFDNFCDQIRENFLADAKDYPHVYDCNMDENAKPKSRKTITESADADTLVLERDDCEFDPRTGNVKVDKQVFDAFIKDYYVDIQFTDDNADVAYIYKMISEDEHSITMEYVGEEDEDYSDYSERDDPLYGYGEDDVVESKKEVKKPLKESEFNEEAPHKYRRYTFNIQVLPTDDMSVDSIPMSEVPQSVLDALADEIRDYPSPQMVVWDSEYADLDDDKNDYEGELDDELQADLDESTENTKLVLREFVTAELSDAAREFIYDACKDAYEVGKLDGQLLPCIIEDLTDMDIAYDKDAVSEYFFELLNDRDFDNELDESFDSNNSEEWDWYENGDDHPLLGLFEKACDELGVWSEPSVQAGQGGDFLRSVEDDSEKYVIDYSDEIDFMNDLTDVYLSDKLSNVEVIRKIKEFIQAHPSKNVSESVNKNAPKLAESVDWGYYDKFTDIEDKYLPPTGEGDTMAKQIVTAVTKLVYKWYNDGDVFDNNYGMEGWANDLSSYANWLYKYAPETKPILERIENCTSDDSYDELLKDLTDLTNNEEYLSKYDKPVEGSIYDCEGPYWFSSGDEDDEDECDEEDELDESVDKFSFIIKYDNEDGETVYYTGKKKPSDVTANAKKFKTKMDAQSEIELIKSKPEIKNPKVSKLDA